MPAEPTTVVDFSEGVPEVVRVGAGDPSRFVGLTPLSGAHALPDGEHDQAQHVAAQQAGAWWASPRDDGLHEPVAGLGDRPWPVATSEITKPEQQQRRQHADGEEVARAHQQGAGATQISTKPRSKTSVSRPVDREVEREHRQGDRDRQRDDAAAGLRPSSHRVGASRLR